MFKRRKVHARISAPRYVISFNPHTNPLKMEYRYLLLQMGTLRPRDIQMTSPGLSNTAEQSQGSSPGRPALDSKRPEVRL